MPLSRLQRSRHLEQFAPLRSLNFAATNALNANGLPLNAAARLDLNALQVGTKRAPTNAGDFATDAAQVLGLAAFAILVAFGRLLAAHVTLRSHDSLRYVYAKTSRPIKDNRKG
jgi:hypothetical protein